MEENASKNFSYVTLGRIIPAGTLAVFYLIFASVLEPSDYGEVAYLIALAGTFSVIYRFGLPQTLVVFKAKGNLQLTNQINLLAIITTSAATVILLFINEFSALLCLGISFFFLYQHNLLGEKRYSSFMKNAILRSVLILIIPFPLYFVFDISGIILGMALGNIVSSVLLVKNVTLKVKSFQILKNNFKVLINNFGVDTSANLVIFIDRLLIGSLFGFVSLGVYHFIMQMLFGLEILPRALYLFLLSEESRDKKHKNIIYFVVLASGIMVIVVFSFSPLLIEQFFPNYSDGIFPLQILITSLIPLSISHIFTAKLQATQSTKVGYSAIIRIDSLLILLSILGSIYGLIGFAFSVLISSILNTVFLFFLYYRYNRQMNVN